MSNLNRAIGEKFTKLEKLIKSALLQPGMGYRVSRGPGGTTLFIKPSQGGGAVNTFFRLYVADEVEDEEVTANKIRVGYSTLAGEAPDGFTEGGEEPFMLTVTEDGVVFAHVEIESTTGEILARTIEQAAELPDNTDTDYYEEIGSFYIDDETDGTVVVQGRYGPVPVSICRNWFSNPITFGLTFLS